MIIGSGFESKSIKLDHPILRCSEIYSLGEGSKRLVNTVNPATLLGTSYIGKC